MRSRLHCQGQSPTWDSGIASDYLQIAAMNLLVDQLGRRYVMPDSKLRFHVLGIEFMSQAKGGSHFLATNQIVTNGILQLERRISAERNLDINEPQLFSLSIDRAMACINVHWLSKNAESGAFSYHMKKLFQYFLDVDGLRAAKTSR